MSPRSNRSLLLGMWAYAGLMAAVAIGVMAVSIARGEFFTPAVMASGMVAFGGYLVFLRRRFRRMLQHSSPEPIIAFTLKATRRAGQPHLHLVGAANAALYRALWGQPDRALIDLEIDDWGGAPDLYQANKYRVRAIIRFLTRRDIAAGLADAELALRMCTGPAVPGMRTAIDTATALVTLGRMLYEGVSPDRVAELEAYRARAKQPLDQALADWGLGVGYQALGRSEEAAAVLAGIRSAAPHWKPLHDFTLDSTPSPVAEAATAIENACARHPERAATVTCIRCGDYACAACAHGARPSVRVCAECHQVCVERRQEHLTTERRIRACGPALRLLTFGWGAMWAGAALVAALRGQMMPTGLTLLPMIVFAAMVFPQGGAIGRLDPTGRRGLTMLGFWMFMMLPIGWLLAPFVLALRFGKKGRFVLSPDYVRVVEATPEIEGKAAPRFAALLLLGIALGTAMMLSTVMQLFRS